MIIYVDSSALLKRVLAEAESEALENALGAHFHGGDTLASSALAWVEVERALRTSLSDHRLGDPGETAIEALAGIGSVPIGPEVIEVARTAAPRVLRSLDALHLATAMILEADVLFTYDTRLELAAGHNGIAVSRPR